MTKFYLYGLISSNENKNFGVLDLSASQPIIINSKSFKGLSAIYSEIELEKDAEVIATRKNMVNHQKTIERVMEEHNILPFTFGMVVDSMDHLKEVIVARFDYFTKKLASIDGKIELSLKGMWNDMTQVYDHILKSNNEISKYKSRLNQMGNPDQNEKIELGKMVEYALTLEKERLSDHIITRLSGSFKDYRMSKNITDNMFCNLAFLVNKEKEPEFDQLINNIGAELNDNTTFKYVGPMPPYSFIDQDSE